MHSLRVWAWLLALFALLAVVPAPPKTPRPERPPVLGSDVAPLSYNLRIAPAKWDFHGGTADGEETILVAVRKSVSSLVLNAALIRVISADIDGRPARASVYRVAQQIAFATGDTLAPGRHTLHVKFAGRILPDAAGLWPDALGSPISANLVTLFEPSRARTLFPCFDEPRFRARFTLHVVAPSGWSVISNMPLAQKAPAGADKSTFTFAPTPPIPPYLLTIDMGEFTAVHGKAGKTPITVYIRPGKEPTARSVLHDAQDSLAFYERDLGVAYPMPKLDIVVASGVLNDAEEGLGAITIYTEYDVSGKQFGGGIRGRREAFDYVAQPIAQQWFGGLAGIQSWKDAWLTASLGSWAEARAQAQLHPEFAAIPKDIDWAWNAISLWGSLDPLRKGYADDRDQAAFASLMAAATDSGEAVADQWDAYDGDARMRAAAHRYLESFAWRSATSADFWSAFNSSAASHYGHAWLNEPGAPVIDINVRCRGGKQFATLRQHPIRSGYFRSRRETLWPVPASVSAGAKTSWTLLAAKHATVAAGSCGGAVLVDKGLRPQYPVHYSMGDLRKLQDAPLASVDRTRILRDTATLYHGASATLPEMLAALRIGVRAPGLLEHVYGILGDLTDDAQALQGSPYAGKFFASVNASLIPVLQRAGFSKNASTDQNNLARMYAVVAYDPQPAFAHSVLDAWRAARASSSFFPFSDWSVLPYAAAAGQQRDFDWALANVRNTPNEILQNDPFWFLAGARDASTITRILDTLHERRIDYPSSVWAIGKYEPRIVSAYLDAHVHDVLSALPPTQQANALAYGVSNGPWTARTPAAWRAFFERVLSHSDKATIDGAMGVIEQKWTLRHRLEAQLRNAHT